MFSGFIEVGGYNGLWEKFGDSIGKPYLPTVAPTTMAHNASNLTTVATTLASAAANMTTAMPSNAPSLSACFKLTPYWGNMFRPIDDPDYPWLGLWTTLPIMGIWYWCTDQVCRDSVLDGYMIVCLGPRGISLYFYCTECSKLKTDTKT